LESLIGRLRAAPAGNTASSFTVPVDRYLDPARLERERATVLRAPRIVAASSEILPGACMPIDLPDASALLVRDGDGVLRAFANACRHRGTRLVDAPCAAKAFVCPYHGWTYGMDGALMHVPHAEAFLNIGKRDLATKPVAERHGLIWFGEGAETYARELDADLSALGLADHVLYRRSRVTRRCNWKLVIEAFLDAYHIRVLHRDSVYRFFLDATSVAERVGSHIRAATARRAIREAGHRDPRLVASPSFMIFPASTIVMHPDYVSVLVVHPLATDLTDWHHMMLVPRARAGETDHWDKSWTLIEETVFQSEDLWVCEQIQKGLGELDELLFGSLEEPIAWFHEAVERATAR
jgi:phenylpropionate dioxygenase-like ring-hydroxylating dioxygenase large terminal subunit